MNIVPTKLKTGDEVVVVQVIKRLKNRFLKKLQVVGLDAVVQVIKRLKNLFVKKLQDVGLVVVVLLLLLKKRFMRMIVQAVVILRI